MNNNFKVQIPNSIVRSSTLNPIEFVITAKLIQTYYMQPGDNKPYIFEIDHRRFRTYINIHKNETFKKHLVSLCNKGIIMNEIESFPRKEGLRIKINPSLINSDYFTQINYKLINQRVIDDIGHIGVRLMYYYESFINRKEGKQFCFVGVETIQKDLGISNKTITEYNKKLKKAKLLKIESNPIDHDYYTTNNGERLLFTKYNNHYYVKVENIDKYYS